MSSYNNNIYYNPEKYGLEVVIEMELGQFFDYDTYVVYKHNDGSIFYTHDAGCSCPTPFEMVGFEDLQLITPQSFDSFCDMIDNVCEASKSEKFTFISAVKKALRV